MVLLTGSCHMGEIHTLARPSAAAAEVEARFTEAGPPAGIDRPFLQYLHPVFTPAEAGLLLPGHPAQEGDLL